MGKPTLILSGPRTRGIAAKWVATAPHNTIVTFTKPGRTIPQNDRMWAMLTDVSMQTTLQGVRKTPPRWKAIFMDALDYEVGFENGLNGEPFPVGFESSKMTVGQMSDMMELIASYGAEHGVIFKDGVE